MHQFLTDMNNPQIVANFQKIFGLEWKFDENNTISDKTNYVDNNNNTTNNNQNQENTHLRSRKENPSEKNAQAGLQNGLMNGHSVGSNHLNNSNSSEDYHITHTDHTHIVSKTKINNKFWFYFFHIGAAMGNEIFYSIFFPCWFWNVDGAIARKITVVWGIYMYIGQATKDLFCMPRPASPPVVKLEQRYVLEYGFPSTHAMVACGLPVSLVLLSDGRYNINLSVSLIMAMMFCLWVCCSRLYLGMHSLLDVTAGVAYALFVLIFTLPVLEPIDHFIMTYESAPSVLFPLGLLICYSYPTVKKWSTTRGDTAIVIGTVIGFSLGASLNNYIGLLNKPDKPPLYDIRYPDAFGFFTVFVRTFLGMTILLATRQLVKPFWKYILCKLFCVNSKDIEGMRKKRIEIPHYYLTYLILGFNVTFSSPYIFRLLNIERDYEYTEL